MANNNVYSEYLMHSGRKGMKWGRNIYQPDYKPVGKLASANKSEYKLGSVTSTIDRVYQDTHANNSESIYDKISDEKKLADNLYKTFDKTRLRYKGPKATLDDDFKTFMKRDIGERIDKFLDKRARERADDYAERINKLINSKGLQTERILLKSDKPASAVNYITKHLKTDEDLQRYGKAIVDFLIPTDRKRTAKVDDSFGDFMRKDIHDRFNASTNNLKKKIKKKLTSKKTIRKTKKLVQKGAKKIAELLSDID